MRNNIVSISDARRIEHRRKVLIFTIVTVFLIALITILSSTMIMANTKTSNEDYKYFKSVEIEEGDTLWSIACEYMTKEHYDSMDDYISEIKNMNGITEDTIQSGQHLIVAYYSSEYK